MYREREIRNIYVCVYIYIYIYTYVNIEDVFMPSLFKVVRTALAAPACSWKTVRACYK